MNPEFDRRRFLELASAGIVGTALGSAGASCSSADDSATTKGSTATPPATPGDAPPRGETVVARAWARAQARGVPLLILLDMEGTVEASGHAWGVYLNLASDAAYADLALCEIACARVGDAYAIWREELRVDEPRPRALVVRTGTPALQRVAFSSSGLEENDLWRTSTASRRTPWIKETESQLHAVIAPDEASFVRAAAIVLGSPPDSRAACELELATRARRALTKTAPAGAKWGTQGLCGGFTYDDGTEAEPAYACGTAMLDDESRRFLRYFAVEAR